MIAILAILIVLVLILILKNNKIENMWFLPWKGNSTYQYDLRSDPNIIYKKSDDGNHYPYGYIYAPYIYDTTGNLKKIPNQGYWIY